MWQNRELLQNFPYLQALQQPVIRELSRNVTLEHLSTRTGPVPLNSFCEEHGLIFPLGKSISITDPHRTEDFDPQKHPIMCPDDRILVTEADMQYLFLSAERADNILHRIPAFRFFWEEDLGLPIPTEFRI